VVDVNDTVTKRLAKNKKAGRFSDLFPSMASNNYLIGPGDIIEVTIWEASPAMLFSVFTPTSTMTAGTSNGVTLPPQMVDSDGMITIPFAGRVLVKGRPTKTIQSEIVQQLKGKANRPQVLVRVTKNSTSNVTIVGDVNSSTMMPLTPKGERLLDALAASGG